MSTTRTTTSWSPGSPARCTRARPTSPTPAVVAARLQAALAHPPEATVTTLVRRGGKVVAAGAVISALAVAGAGAAAAANPYSGVARVVEDVAQSVGLEWSAMPDGYTREQYEAFWGAGYTVDDMEALADLWHLDATATKAQAGQLLLDGQTPPIAPGGAAAQPADVDQARSTRSGRPATPARTSRRSGSCGTPNRSRPRRRQDSCSSTGEPLPLD